MKIDPVTRQINLTGLLALSLLCGLRDSLPVGLQLAGRRWEESLLFGVAYAFEQSVDWKTL